MESIKYEKFRSKSTGFLDKLVNELDSERFCGYRHSDNPHASASSVGTRFECDGAGSSIEELNEDSGIGKSFLDGETLYVLDQKIDKLSELLQEQRNLLMSIKENVVSGKTNNNRYSNIEKCAGSGGSSKDNEEVNITNETFELGASSGKESIHGDQVTGARSLLNAIEMKQDVSLDHIIRVALESFLQSDDVREHMVAATAECVKGVVQGNLCHVVTDAYVPMVERSHRRLVKHVTKLLDDSFSDLEEGTATLFKSVQKTSRNIRMSLEKHYNLLEATDPAKNIELLRATLKGVLEEELKTWRCRVMQELRSQDSCNSASESESPEPSYADCAPMSPMQPANPEASAIDTLMKCALITKHIRDGDVNGAFEEALSSADLSLVMAACRAAAPACGMLQPAVLLSLLQQLATDMVHDTQLKCKYLEEAILSLDKCDAATQEHLPLVLGEVRKHLTKFLISYPKHHANRRIALIVMAADNLLK